MQRGAVEGETSLPPTVHVDLHEPGLRSYWRRRAEQHVCDSYAGVPMTKFPEDLRVYEHLLWLDAPDTVIELGTQWAGSALWFRDRLETLRHYGRIARAPTVVSVDVAQDGPRDRLERCGNAGGVALVEGDLADPQVVERVASLVGDRCFVVEDSAHTLETTRAALENYSRFVPPGGFMVVEDGCVDDEELRFPHWPRGVRAALDAWLQSPDGAEFTARRDLELYGITCHPSGFLQRHAAPDGGAGGASVSG
jgi:cephalosporin hydroxylase